MQERNQTLPNQNNPALQAGVSQPFQPNQNFQPEQPTQPNQEPQFNQPTQDNEQNQQDQQYFPGMQKPIREELVFQWQAPSRPFKKRKKQYFTTVATIVLLLCLILFFAGQFLPVAVVLAVAFLSYTMATIPPHTVTNSFSTHGVRNEKDFYAWEELSRFWFDKKHDDKILYIEVNRFPFRLMLLVGNEDEDEIAEILSEVLIAEKPPLTETERLAAWLQKKVPLDIDS
jgi:hypothetical protein